jgi:hypothetical protein
VTPRSGTLVGMGLIGDWVKSKHMKDPVRGTLQVTAATYPPDDATSANFSINGVVSGDGIPPTAVEHAGVAKTKKWPQSGQALPVTVDRADPTRLRIEWDEVEDSWTSARRTTEQLAEAMRGQGASAPTAGAGAGMAAAMPGMNALSTTIDATGIPGLREEIVQLAMNGGTPEQVMAALRQHGINVPGGAMPLVNMVQGSALQGGGAAPEEDPAARLRKLQELRDGNLITVEEYEAQRAKILGEL